jgi:hypothetical protein
MTSALAFVSDALFVKSFSVAAYLFDTQNSTVRNNVILITMRVFIE